MPCKAHHRNKEGCVPCVTAELLLFRKLAEDPKGEDLVEKIKALGTLISGALDNIDLDSEDGQLFQVLVAEANGAALKAQPSIGKGKLLKLQQEGGGVDVPYDLGTLQPLHFRAYRQYVGRLGTWLGMSELQVLAMRFHVSFRVYFEANGRFYDLGAQKSRDYSITSHCLVFTGAHWEVGVLAYQEDRVESRVQTNPYGNCCIEAFLTLLSVEHKVAPAFKYPKLWTWITQFRQLRKTHCDGDDWDKPVPVLHANPVTQLVRNFLKQGMNETEVRDALAAVPGLRLSQKFSTSSPGSGKSEEVGTVGGLKWNKYVAHVLKYFELTSALTCEADEGKGFVNITNISQFDSQEFVKKQGKTAMAMLGLSGKPPSRSALIIEKPKNKTCKLTHLGFMVAKVVSNGAPTYVLSVIANFAAGRRTLVSPYMVTGTTISSESVPGLGKGSENAKEGELFYAFDMHTECYSYFLLDRFIQTQLDPSTVEEISVEFVLQLNMCDRCLSAKQLFEARYAKQFKHFDAFTVEHGDTVEGTLIQEFIDTVDWSTARTAWDPFDKK
jgi:hypothetical protein